MEIRKMETPSLFEQACIDLMVYFSSLIDMFNEQEALKFNEWPSCNAESSNDTTIENRFRTFLI